MEHGKTHRRARGKRLAEMDEGGHFVNNIVV